MARISDLPARKRSALGRGLPHRHWRARLGRWIGHRRRLWLRQWVANFRRMGWLFALLGCWRYGCGCGCGCGGWHRISPS